MILKYFIASIALLFLTVHLGAQEPDHFQNSFDTLPTFQKKVADVREGYIVMDDEGGALEANIMTADFQSQTRNDTVDIPFEYWIALAPNSLDLAYSIDAELKLEGEGSLCVKFKRGDTTYYGGVETLVFFPPFDARGANFRFSIRSENDAGQGVYVYLLDEMYRPCGHWAFYNPPPGQWLDLEMHQGQPSGAARYKHDQDDPGDITRVSGIQITLYAYDEDVSAEYRLDDLRITPAPRTYFSTVMDISGEFRLRSQADVDGVEAGWFDPQLDDTDWKKAIVPSFWSEDNNPIAWYRMRFTLSEDVIAGIRDSPSYLLFKGVDESAWVWLNGVELGSHSEERKEGWDQPFAFDITKHLDLDSENLLVVKVLNREQGGGIWRPISIVTKSDTADQ